MKLDARGVDVMLGGRPVVTGASLGVAAGEMVGLIGPNGAGKSTLVRVLAGLEIPSAGEVLLDGVLLAGIAPRARARAIAFLPQEARVHWRMTVWDVVMLGRSPHRGGWSPPREKDIEAVARAMAAARVTEFAEREAIGLSAGERARVMLARALAVEAGALLADEPAAALDPRHQISVLDQLRRAARSGAAVLVVLHDLALAARYMDRLVLMDQGRLVLQGTPSEVLADDRLERTFGVRLLKGEQEGAAWALPWARATEG